MTARAASPASEEAKPEEQPTDGAPASPEKPTASPSPPPKGTKPAWSEGEAQALVESEAEGRVHGGYIAYKVSTVATGAISRRPCAVCCSCCCLIFFLSGIVIAAGAMKFNLEGPKDWNVLSEPNAMAADTISSAEEKADCVSYPDICPIVTERSRSNIGTLGVSIIYDSKSGPIFTPSNLQQICKVERVLLGSADYPEVCPLGPTTAKDVRGAGGVFKESDCLPQEKSIVTMFYAAASVDPKSCPLLPAAAVDATAQQLYHGLTQASTLASAGLYVGSDAMSNGNWSGSPTRRTRSFIALGFPLYGRTDTEDDFGNPEPKLAYTDAYYADVEEAMLKHFGKEHGALKSPWWDHFESGNLEVHFRSSYFFDLEFRRLVDGDMRFAAFSIIFVWIYLIAHTGSFAVGSVSLFQIVMSIPFSLIFYKFIFQITYFRQLHGLLIFIMLGVGADDVFVFSDAWKQSKKLFPAVASSEQGESEAEANCWGPDSVMGRRLFFSYKHTLLTVFNTSLTTGVAFLATASSPIMPIKSMGVYAMLLVFANYLFAITLTPSVFVVSELYLPDFPLLKYMKRGSSAKVQPVSGDDAPAGGAETAAPVPADAAPAAAPAAPAAAPAAAVAAPVVDKLRSSAAPWIVRRALVPFFKLPGVAPVSVFICFVWGIVNIVLAAQLSTPTEGFTYFHEDHMVERSKVLDREGFAVGAQASYNPIAISFGIKGIDRDAEPGVDPWKPHEWYGIPIWDEAFDLSNAPSQQFLRNFCLALRAKDCASKGCQPFGMLVQQASDSVSCFIEEFDAWNGGQKYTGQQFMDKLLEFRQTTTPSNTALEGGDWKKTIGFVNGKLRFVVVRAWMSLMTRRGDELKEEVLDMLEKWLDTHRTTAPPGMGSIYQAPPFDFILLEISNGLVNGLFSGFAICFPLAFLVLLFATRNWYIAFTAILTVGLIVGSVLGYCYMAGWFLGPGECVAGIIVIGLSVDYCIHLGHMYLEGEYVGLHKRKERWEFALNAMGVTVIAGAVTTFVAAFVMQFCQIVFFNQMSTLMMLTVVYSWVYATFLFMAFLSFAGPENSQGDVTWIVEKCARLFRRRKE